jgi:hypothetical protein
MLRETLCLLVIGAAALGCASSDTRPGTNTTLCVPVDGGAPCRGIFGGPGGGRTPTLDSGVTPADAPTADALAATVSGALRLFQDLPPRATRIAGTAGWTIRALPTLGGVDAGAGATLEGITGGAGDFTLPGLPPTATSPTTGLPSYWLAAGFPVMGNLESMFEVPAEARSIELQTVTDDTLRTSLNAAGLVQADDRALIAVWVRESRAAGARAVEGVTIEAEGQSTQTLYDGASGIMELSATGTGPLGFAILPNVPVAASGDGLVTVQGTRMARPYAVRVRRQTVTWVVLTAS